jgi:hypothetical protein
MDLFQARIPRYGKLPMFPARARQLKAADTENGIKMENDRRRDIAVDSEGTWGDADVTYFNL